MRDVIKEYAQSSVTESAPGPCPVSYSLSTKYLSRLRGRSEVIQGNHIDPTYYAAYKADVHGVPMDLDSTITYSFYCNGSYGRRRWNKSGIPATPSTVYLVGMSGANFAPIVPNSVVSRARNNTLNKLSDSDVDIGESLVDVRESAMMLARATAKLASVLNALRKGHWAVAAKRMGVNRAPRSKELSEGWLAYQYGVRPLVNDVVNGRKAINDAFNRDGFKTVKIKSVAVEEGSFPNDFSFSYSGSNTRGCQVGLTYVMSNATLASLNALGLVNPLLIAWNALTLSFVVDWVFSIGSFLKAMSAPLGFTYQSGYETQFIRGNYTVRYNNYDSVYAIGQQPSFHVKNFSMRRTSFGGDPPKPSLYMKLNLDINKVLSSLALLRVRL